MKRHVRYSYALRFVEAKLQPDEEVSMKHPLVLEAASRFQLAPPQMRRLVSHLRKRSVNES